MVWDYYGRRLKMIKRILNAKQIEALKQLNKFKDKDVADFTDKDYRELVILIAKKLGIIK